MNYFKRLMVVLFLCLAGLVFSSADAKASVNAPIIEAVARGAFDTLAEPMITGTTDNGTDALIYIDGSYQGTGVANIFIGSKYRFFFQQPRALSQGPHNVMIIARNKATSELSAPSASAYFIVPPVSGQESAPISGYIPAPTLLSPNEETITTNQKEIITGLTQSGTSVLVYIDGVYNGKTKVVSHPSGTGAFLYAPFLNLSRGEHKAYAVAEDELGNRSVNSRALEFVIEYPMPAPTLIRAVVNGKTTASRPFITGVVKNHSTVKVIIDGKLDGEFTAKNDASGTANFAYKPSFALLSGKTHKIYALAVDARGKESARSNQVNYLYPQPALIAKTAPKAISGTPKITQPAKDKKSEEIPAVGIEKSQPLPGESATPDETGQNNNLGQENSTDDQDRVSEKVSTSTLWLMLSGKLNLNLVIFLVFLAGVIIWIIWVNRELSRERKEKEAMMSHEDAKDSDNSQKESLPEKFDQLKNQK